MKTNSKLCWIAILAVIGVTVPFVQLAPGWDPPPGSCNETGPHYGDWICLQSGVIINSGHLSWTNRYFCLDGEIVAPSLTGADFGPGLKKRNVTFDCKAGWSETNTVSYTPLLYFDPDFPTVASAVGTNTYDALLMGVADGGCTNLGPVLVSVVTVVVVSPDHDTSPPEFTITYPAEGANL